MLLYRGGLAIRLCSTGFVSPSKNSQKQTTNLQASEGAATFSYSSSSVRARFTFSKGNIGGLGSRSSLGMPGESSWKRMETPSRTAGGSVKLGDSSPGVTREAVGEKVAA